MEVSAEAKRIMVVALGKLYSSRTQRGGLRLHRSLLLTLVMKSARDMYHEAQAGRHAQQSPSEEVPEPRTGPLEEVVDSGSVRNYAREDKENRCPSSPAPHSRKRRGKAATEPDFLPCKKARLEQTLLLGYGSCSSGLGALPSPIMPLHRAVAAC
ncbi:immediate early response gene 2 protein [Anoplopoma fimbria]|uniref:immediate early response gene 2 protein n=1 Tax=Anoplopoma fimbria TaxID=229290 RepID=UPI0023ECF9A2|nr:immediate early response gene 2 protein [Anoplopoma fimbria]